MRHSKLITAVLAFTAAGLLAGAAHGQNFFQKVFGFGGSERAPPALPRFDTRVIPASRLHGRGIRRPELPQLHDERDDDAGIGPPDTAGPYRTLCVRTCDGYYFPLRHNALHKNFVSDVKSCSAACGSDARLFYYSLSTGSPDTMEDLAGRKYAALPHAFAYRKSLVSGCSCKAVPWSSEESARHQHYEDIEAAELVKDKAFLEARAADEVAHAMAVSAGDPADAKPVDASVATPSAPENATETLVSPPPTAENAVAYLPDAPAPRRRAPRPHRAQIARTQIKTAASGSLFFGASKSKYVWPGDAR